MGTTTNNYLNQTANAMSGNTYYIPNYLAVATTEVTAIATDATALEGEIGTRETVSNTVSENIITYTAIRDTASVIDTANGDDINSSGLHGTISGNDLMAGVIHNGITQTTNFDLEFIYEFTIDRPQVICMSLDQEREFGKVLGKLSEGQENTNQNIAPDESEAQDIVFDQNRVVIRGNVKVYRRDISSTAFIMDSPVQGEVDSSVYEIDGLGYVTDPILLDEQNFQVNDYE